MGLHLGWGRGQTKMSYPPTWFQLQNVMQVRCGWRGRNHCTGIVLYNTTQRKRAGGGGFAERSVRDRAMLVVRLEEVMRPGMRPGRSEAPTGDALLGRGRRIPDPCEQRKRRRWPKYGFVQRFRPISPFFFSFGFRRLAVAGVAGVGFPTGPGLRWVMGRRQMTGGGEQQHEQCQSCFCWFHS